MTLFVVFFLNNYGKTTLIHYRISITKHAISNVNVFHDVYALVHTICRKSLTSQIGNV